MFTGAKACHPKMRVRRWMRCCSSSERATATARSFAVPLADALSEVPAEPSTVWIPSLVSERDVGAATCSLVTSVASRVGAERRPEAVRSEVAGGVGVRIGVRFGGVVSDLAQCHAVVDGCIEGVFAEGRVVAVPELSDAVESFGCFVEIVACERCEGGGRGVGRVVPLVDAAASPVIASMREIP